MIEPERSTVIKVVAAVFQQNNKYLACRRKPGLSNGGQWEFPGGKQNKDESPSDALSREIDEELNVVPVIGDSLGTSVHHYPDKSIELHCLLVERWVGEFSPTDHDRLAWYTVDELLALELSDADRPFVVRIKELEK